MAKVFYFPTALLLSHTLHFIIFTKMHYGYYYKKVFYFPTVLLLIFFVFYYSSHTLSPLYTYYLYFTIMLTLLISPESIPDELFISPNSNPKEIVKHGGGRPKNIVWNYFEHNALKHSGHYDAKCNFCGTYWKNGIVKNLQVHLASKCENVDIETKNKFMHYVAIRDGIINENLMEIESDDGSEELSEERVALIDRSILKAFVMCAIPFRIIENPYFINVLKNLQPNYSPPSRERLTTNLLSEESIRTEIKIKNYIEKEKNLTLGIKNTLNI